jgi:glycosyltransferase involved in cell wall biosynthesis
MPGAPGGVEVMGSRDIVGAIRRETGAAGSARRDHDRPRSGSWIRAAGIALDYLKRVIPPPLRPRLSRGGQFYDPRPLTVPVGYLRARPPNPAPTITIVTPAGKDTPYLRRTIESVIAQDYPRLDYIVVHDGSNGSVFGASNGELTRLRCLESWPDRGQAAAINAGFRASGGEIMGWINADDMLLPGALAYVSRFFAARPEVDVVYGHRVLLDEHDRDIGFWVTPRHSADSLQWLDWIPQETVFWRRRVWEAVGEIDEEFALAFDWDLFSRFHASGARIVRLPRFLGAYRRHPAQKTRVYHETALVEQAKIREWWHGRPTPPDEVRARIFPYLLRSLPYNAWYAVRARVPHRRARVPSLAADRETAVRRIVRSQIRWNS